MVTVDVNAVFKALAEAGWKGEGYYHADRKLSGSMHYAAHFQRRVGNRSDVLSFFHREPQGSEPKGYRFTYTNGKRGIGPDNKLKGDSVTEFVLYIVDKSFTTEDENGWNKFLDALKAN